MKALRSRTSEKYLVSGSVFLILGAAVEGTLFTAKKELYQHIDFFSLLIGREKPTIERNIAVNIEVSEKFAQLYNECRI